MSTVEQAMDFAKQIVRDIRAVTYRAVEPLDSSQRMIVNTRLAVSLRLLASELEDYIPLPEVHDERPTDEEISSLYSNFWVNEEVFGVDS